MKTLAALLGILLLVGCASTQPRYTQRAVTVEELRQINSQLTQNDCPRIDYWVNYAEAQERMRNVYGRDPSDLDEEDRMYHAQARIIVWSLRKGCANK